MSGLTDKILPGLARRAWLIVLATVGVTLVALLVSELTPKRYTMESVVVTRARDAIQAARTAQTYAESIPEDGGAINAVAEVVGRDPDDVAEDIQVIGDAETSVLRLRVQDSDRERVLVAGRALVKAVTGDPARARSVFPGTVDIVRQPRIIADTTVPRATVIQIGILLGLCLGAVLVVARERSDRRIDNHSDLAQELSVPVTTLRDVGPGNALALIERWHSVTVGDSSHNGSRPNGSIALLPATGSSKDAADAAAARFVDLGHEVDHPFELRQDSLLRPSADARLVLATGGLPGGPAAGERLATEADLVILAVAAGARAAEVHATVDVLAQLGVRPGWALLVSS